MSKDKDWRMICLAKLRMRVGKECSLCALFIGVVIISNSISGGETGLKKNELAKFNFGTCKYPVNCLGEFGILEAKLYPMDEKYLQYSLCQESQKDCVIQYLIGPRT